MSERENLEGLFVQSLPLIESILAKAALSQGLRGADAEDFASWTTARIVETSYAVLRKWRKDSSLATYLRTVLFNFAREYRVRLFGRWRASAAATRLGPLGVRLERLLYRDGWPLPQAIQLLRQRKETMLSDAALQEIASQIPPRSRSRHTDDPDAGTPEPDDEEVADWMDLVEGEERMADARESLMDGLLKLSAVERIVVTMHYFQGLSLADVSRALNLPQKPLYRTRDGALDQLRCHLEADGFSWQELRELIGVIDAEPPLAAGEPPGIPSNLEGRSAPGEGSASVSGPPRAES